MSDGSSNKSSDSDELNEILSGSSDAYKQNSDDQNSNIEDSSNRIVSSNDKKLISKQNQMDENSSSSISLDFFIENFSDENEESQVEPKKMIINVPQGFYAKITPNTPKNIIGLFTDGLGPCACVILTNSDHSYMFLAHADVAAMNICDPKIGIPAWIKEMEQERNTIELYCGVDTGIDAGDYPYKSLIEASLIANDIKGININVFNRSELQLKASSGIILRKDAEEFIFTDKITGKNYEIKNDGVYLNFSGDPLNGLRDSLKNQFNIEDLYDIKSWRLDEIEVDDDNQIKSGGKLKISRFNIAKKVDSTYKDIGDLPFPPICCFDGTNFKTKTELEEYMPIITEYEDKLIEIYKTTGHLRKDEQRPYTIGKFFEEYNKLNIRETQQIIAALTPKNTPTLGK